MTFAEKIKSLRKERGLTQLQLAQASNISLAVIAGVESGRRNPSKEMAKRLSSFFGVPIQAFIFEDATTDAPQQSQQTTDIPKLLQIEKNLRDVLESLNLKLSEETIIKCIEYFYSENITDPNVMKHMFIFSLKTNQTQEPLAH